MDYLHDKLYKGILITYNYWNIGPSLCNKIHQIKDITLMSNLVAVESKNTGYKKNSSFFNHNWITFLLHLVLYRKLNLALTVVANQRINVNTSDNTLLPTVWD